MTETTRRIIAAIEAIPPGKVSCYRDIALAAGLPNGARQVVRVLHSMSRVRNLPWFRVIKANGRIAFAPGDGLEEQAALLRSEGVEVSGAGLVNLARFGVTVIGLND
ncbi:MAG: MGMT family protein [Spirochaetaceae bacterium]|jgi:methylated-DNA-protein-cysteine methyltransferase-like protein|nr:MGMT family protein [Spirochaetaceae bacterium]